MNFLTRREFFRFLSIAAVGFLSVGRVFAAAKKVDLPPGKTAVSEDDTVAKSLGYKADTAKVDKAKYPSHKKDQTCRKCVFYKKENEGWGECQVIKGGLVNANGWCASYNQSGAN